MSAMPRRSARPLEARQAARNTWDLVVIGAGSAGLVAARTAGFLGARVLLIESGLFGGECLHTGCVPSKALIAAAHAAHAARVGAGFGIHSTEIRVDYGEVMAHVRGAIGEIEPVDSPEALARDGVHTLVGRARFDGARSVVVDGQRIRFRDAVLATGSVPVHPDVPGAETIQVLTNETFWDVDELPERLLVMGGGAIGCELAQAMARLGSLVTLVHRGSRLLPKEEPAASALVLAALRADGVDVRLETTIDRLEAGDADAAATRAPGGVAHLSDGSEAPFDRMLAALGRRARTEGLDLDAAGIALDEKGAVAVDASMRTSNPRIRAAGDVTPLPRFTHTAGSFGSTAATNALLGLSRKADLDVVPRVTFTSPEVAAVGVPPEQAESRGMHVLVQDHAHVDRAISDADTAGRTSVVVDKRGRVRGASIVGPRAGESLAEYTLAVRAGIDIRRLATTTHPYPTYSDAGWNAVVRDVQSGLRTGVVGGAVRVLAAVHRRRG